jgi:hypothetical protein
VRRLAPGERARFFAECEALAHVEIEVKET